MLRLREVASQDERSRSVRSKRKTKSVTKMKGTDGLPWPEGEVFFLTGRLYWLSPLQPEQRSSVETGLNLAIFLAWRVTDLQLVI